MFKTVTQELAFVQYFMLLLAIIYRSG